jgi:hypothetical protein
MNPVAFHEDVWTHLGIPAAGKVSEVTTCGQELRDFNAWHDYILSVSLSSTFILF